MIWMIIAGGVLLLGLSYGAGEAIVGRGEEWWLILGVGLLSIVLTLVLLAAFFYGAHEAFG